jgi:hypothetical protein
VKVFLSYRRDDTGGRAGRLFDVFVARFGAHNVFQDVNAIAPGLDFAAQVEAAIKASDAVLVVIGPHWLGDLHHDGNRRIDRPDDFVRREVSSALAAGIRVVPVLVDGAPLPSSEELPDDVAPLVLRQAVTLRDASWHTDLDDLVRRLEGEQPVAPRRRRWPIVLAGLAGLLVVALVAVALIIPSQGHQRSSGESADSSVPNAAPMRLPAGLLYTSTTTDKRVCGPGGQVALSAGPVQQRGDILTTSFSASAHGLETDTLFNKLGVVDKQGRPYAEIDGGDSFTLGQDGYGKTQYSTEVSVNRDDQAHAGTTGIVLVVTGECTHDSIFLPVSLPAR